MNEPQLIKCEQCYKIAHKTIYLGSLSSQGDLIYRVNNATYSCVMSPNMMIIHDCGFTIMVESGSIKTALSERVFNDTEKSLNHWQP